MLILKRDIDEKVVIWSDTNPDHQLKVSFRKLADGTYQMCFDGPKSFKIFREEVLNERIAGAK